MHAEENGHSRLLALAIPDVVPAPGSECQNRCEGRVLGLIYRLMTDKSDPMINAR
jgi:hypothetical protein